MKSKIKHSKSDTLFYTINNIYLLIAGLVVLYPIIYIISSSFSSPDAVASGKVVLFPVDFSLRGYEAVFEHNDILTGYANTIFYTFFGTVINVGMTILAAYPLSRSKMPGKSIIMFLFTFTMIFNGGLIPSYLVNSELGIINTRWVMLVPGAIAVYNLIIARTFLIANIPEELMEAAQIDGCDHIKFLYKIVVPLAKPLLAILCLYYGVTHWNSYFNAFIYLSDKTLFPLQIILRDILISNSVNTLIVDPELMAAKQGMSDLLKYSLIVVSSAPFMIVYPFVQKHFAKGALTGAVKG